MDGLAGEWVGEFNFPGVEAEGRGAGGEGLGVAEVLAGEVGGIAAHGEAEVPEGDADLVGAAGVRDGFEQGGAIGEAPADVEFGAGDEAGGCVRSHGAGAEVAGVVADGGVAREGVGGRMALDADEVAFLNLALRELGLEAAGEMAGAGDEDESGGIGVQAVRGVRFLRVIDGVEDVLEGVAIKPAAGVHGQGRGFVQDDEGLVFMQDFHRAVDLGFDDAGKDVAVALADADDLVG